MQKTESDIYEDRIKYTKEKEDLEKQLETETDEQKINILKYRKGIVEGILLYIDMISGNL